MTQDRGSQSSQANQVLYSKALASSYYTLLGVHPSASVRDVRNAYRELSKLYHPDTTALPPALATAKFQELNEAYATLSNPERRLAYDQKIGYSRVAVVQPLPSLNLSSNRLRPTSSSAYLDPTDRPLSPGELFALFILGITFVACLVLAIAVGLTRDNHSLLHPETASHAPEIQQIAPVLPALAKQTPAIPALPEKPSLPAKDPAATKALMPAALPVSPSQRLLPSSSHSG